MVNPQINGISKTATFQQTFLTTFKAIPLKRITAGSHSIDFPQKILINASKIWFTAVLTAKSY